MNGGQQTDEELAQLASGGDERAFSDLYNKYFPEVYDYSIRLSRDRDVAALVLQSAFLRLYQSLQSGTLPPSIKLFLFAGAHHDMAERMRARRMPVVEGEEAFAVADPARLGRPASPELHELTRLAWQAARQLRLEEYELLDLNVRRSLSGGEIASFMRTRSQSVQDRLDRATASFEESFTALVLMSYGRRSCLDLDFLVAEDKWSASLRKRVLQHLASCPICQGTRAAYLTGAEALAAIAVAPAPPGWQAIMLSRLLKAREGGEETPASPLLPGAAAAPAPVPVSTPVITAAPEPATTSPYTARPLPTYSSNPNFLDRIGDFGSARGQLLAVFGGGLLIVLMIFGALCSAGAFDGSESADTTGTPTGTMTATTTRTATITATLTSTQTAAPLPTDTPIPTNEPTSVPPTNTPPPPPPTNTPPPPPPTNTPPPVETPGPTP